MYSLRYVAFLPACLATVAIASSGLAQTGTPPVAPRLGDAATPSSQGNLDTPSRDDKSSTAQPVNAGTAAANGDFEVDAKPPSGTPATNQTVAVPPSSSVVPLPPPPGSAQTKLASNAGVAPAVATTNATGAVGPTAANTALQPPSADSTPLVDISGYGQFQYEAHKDSEDQLRQGGSLINQDRFSVRRLRIELSRRFTYAGYLVEIDGNTTNGPALSLMRAEGSVYYQGNAKDQPPLVELTLGQLKVPFGFEVPESSRSRWFMERSTASRAFFPSEVDVGGRIAGAWRFLRYAVALTNGEPKGTKANSFQLQDPNRAKDFVMRLGADARPSDAIQVIGGVTYLTGKGFSAGQDATKSRVLWNDSDQDGKVIPTELTGVPGIASVPAQNFRRWAVGADLRLSARSLFGWTTVFGEAVAAVNMDRGLFIADPIATTYDLRQFGWHVGVMQEITRYSLIGFRFDNYDPDSDLLDKRGGQFLPNNQAIATYSPLVGVTIPERARLIFQYDIVRDHLARDAVGAPTDLANNQWTLRLQVKL